MVKQGIGKNFPRNGPLQPISNTQQASTIEENVNRRIRPLANKIPNSQQEPSSSNIPND